jgi:hypothetical protein
MFTLPLEQRLSSWIDHRQHLDQSLTPLQDVWDFWHTAPFIPHNRNVDPYHQRSWPTPWEIIEHNKYDDFTKALMIGWTLKLTTHFRDSKIEIKTLVDSGQSRQYNLVFVDDQWVINYNDNGPVQSCDLVPTLRLENLIEIVSPR